MNCYWKLIASLFFLIISKNIYAESHTISQKDKKFSAKTIDIKVGDEIVFINNDNTAHHLMYKIDGKRKSHKQKNGDPKGTAVRQKFENEGNVTVRCAIHPKMKLKISVLK